jgi:hypothetical protein
MHTARVDANSTGYLNVLLKLFTLFCAEGNTHIYKVIHNSLTQLMKSVHLNGEMNCNMRRTDRRSDSPSLFLMYFIRSLYVTRQKPNR